MTRAQSFALRFELLSRLRRLLPPRAFAWLWQQYWRSFWRLEQKSLPEGMRDREVSLEGCERAVLAEAIGALYPFGAALELGCARGQNFILWGKLFLRTAFLGIDRDPALIQEGQLLLSELVGSPRFQLLAGSVDVLSEFESRSFDVIFTSGFLLYVPPEQILPLVEQMLRIATRRIYMVEQHVTAEDTSGGLGVPGVPREKEEPYYLRNYEELFSRYVPSDRISIRKVPSPRWITERWQELGSLIEVCLSETSSPETSPP